MLVGFSNKRDTLIRNNTPKMTSMLFSTIYIQIVNCVTWTADNCLGTAIHKLFVSIWIQGVRWFSAVIKIRSGVQEGSAVEVEGHSPRQAGFSGLQCNCGECAAYDSRSFVANSCWQRVPHWWKLEKTGVRFMLDPNPTARCVWFDWVSYRILKGRQVFCSIIFIAIRHGR